MALTRIDRNDYAAAATTSDLALLLTVARILRARLPEMAPAYQDDDMRALNEALAPFDAVQAEPVNTCAAPPNAPR